MPDSPPDRVLNYESPANAPAVGVSTKFLMTLFAVVVLAILAIVAILPLLGKARPEAQIAKCSANLKSIGNALLEYANDNGGRYPDSLDPIAEAPIRIPLETFVCPASADEKAMRVATLNDGGHLSYIYLGKGRKREEMGADDPLACEPLTNHKGAGANVLFGDTHVEFLTPAELAKVLARPTTLPATAPSTMPAH